MASSIENVYTIAPGITATFIVDASGVATKTGSGYISIAKYDLQVFGSARGTTINSVLGELNQGLADRQKSERLINDTIASAKADLNNPNISPDERKWAEEALDPNGDYQRTVVAPNKAAIAAYQTSIAWVNTNFNTSMTKVLDEAAKAFPPAKPTPVPTTTANAAVTTANATTKTTATGTKAPVTGKANDDSGAVKTTTPTTPKTLSPGTPGGPGSPATGKNGSAPVTKTSPNNTNASTPNNPVNQPPEQSVDNTPPGKRLKNPLGQFASYTYQISLYMVTPDAYDLFVASGRTNINAFNSAVDAATASTTGPAPPGGGIFLVAQSGGINNDTEKRAAGFKYDYYIDNLHFDIATNSSDSGGAAIITGIEFTITEPYGFSFMSNLKRATAAIGQYVNAIGGTNWPENPTKQFFILGIRFYGYDQSGRLVTPQSDFNGSSLDPASTNGSLFEHFYDIIISQVDFKIDGRITTYKCTGTQQAAKTAFSVKNGILPSGKTITGSTVGDVLDKLTTALNNEQLALVNAKAINVPTVYSVRYNPGAEEIQQATIISPADLEKSKLPGSGAKTSAGSNDAAGVNATVNIHSKDVVFAQNIPILQCIDQVIKQSSYLENALNVVFSSVTTNDPNKKTIPTITNPTPPPISWFNCAASVSGAKWDEKQKDWIFNIEYVISKYSTPVVTTGIAGSTPKYYGPHKRYEYWYTGDNNEIISYEQTLNNAYQMNLSATTGDNTEAPAEGTSNTNDLNTPKGALQKPAGPSDGRQGQGMDAQNSYVTSLYDPGSWASAAVTILGDPDYLMDSSGSSSLQKVYSQFYGADGFTISPNGGQVFIEIDFKEGVDYVMSGGLNEGGGSTQGGTLSLNNSIYFYDYPESVANIVQGIAYLVTKTECHFQNGKFTQVLTLNIADFGALLAGHTANSASTGNTATSTTDASTPGVKGQPPAPNNYPPADAPVGTSSRSAPVSTTGGAPSKQTPAQGTTPTGPNGTPVANGDATGG